MAETDSLTAVSYYAEYPLPTFARPVQVGGATLYECQRCGLPRRVWEFPDESRKRRCDGTRYMVRRSVCMQCDAADAQVVRHRKYGRLPEGFVFPYREWGMRVDATGDTCPMCKEPGMRMCIDHVVPFHNGGSLDLANLQPICLGCNTKKWHRIERAARACAKDKQPRKSPKPRA